MVALFFLGKGVPGNFFKNISCSITRSLPENLLENYKKFARKLPETSIYQMATRFSTRRLSGKLTEQYNVCVPLETDIQKYLTKFEAAELKCKIFNLFECVIADHSLNSHLNNYQYVQYCIRYLIYVCSVPGNGFYVNHITGFRYVACTLYRHCTL